MILQFAGAFLFFITAMSFSKNFASGRKKKNISLEDIVNLESTCKRFQQITLPNKFWERKYYHRCPTANRKYNVEEKKKIFDYLNFEKQIKTGLKCIKKLQNYVFLMSENKLWDTNKTELKCLLRFIVEDSMLYYFLLDEQKRIIRAGLPWLNDLTYRYNFDLIFNCLKQYRFIYKISKFMNKPRKTLFKKLYIIIEQIYTQEMRLMTAYSSQLTNRMMYKWKSNIVYEIMCYSYYKNSISFERQNIDIEPQYRSITETIEIAVEKPDNTRNKNIKFSIGEIVKHLSQPNFAPPKESIYHEGVIIGWHSKCDPNFQAKMKKTHMFPYLCHHYQNHLICTSCICFNSKCVSDDQPHYIILTENDKICYIREDHIEICSPKKINNIEIGRFFSRFHGFYYEPNKSLANRY